MANIIDTSYFVDDIELPNVNQAPIKAGVEKSIALYEKEVLISLFGYSMYKDFLAATPVAGDKWYKLINGEEFSFAFEGETVTRYWDGLLGADKKSLVAYYIYFMHRRKEVSYMAGVGTEVEAETENSTKVSLYEKLVWIWNEFLLMYGDGCTEGQYNNAEPSAYNYLTTKAANFTNWKFESQGEELNTFGVI